MKLLLCAVTAVLLLVAVGCSGPSDEEVEAKANEVFGRAVPLVLGVGFAFNDECTQLVEDLTAKMDTIEEPAETISNRDAMKLLEELDGQLDQFEQDAAKAGCL